MQKNHGRWAWELLQNAKDSVVDSNSKVSVQINYNHNKNEFSHNGNHFTEKDIRGLINQISSKEVEEGEISGENNCCTNTKIENAWKKFHTSTEDCEIADYDEDKFNSSFTHALDCYEQKERICIVLA